MATTRHIDDMHAVMADYCWITSVAQGSSDTTVMIPSHYARIITVLGVMIP
jgi:hypothetical protein